MMEWQKQKGVAFALRAMGLSMIALAWLLGRYLSRLMPQGARAGVTGRELCVGGALVAAATLGSAFLILGSRLFERVRLSDRWVHLPSRRSRPSTHG